MARVETPVPPISPAAAAALAFGLDPASALQVYETIRREPIASATIWYRLGLGLFGAEKRDEAAACFAKSDREDADPAWRFGAKGWLGLLADLKGRRAEALAHL